MKLYVIVRGVVDDSIISKHGADGGMKVININKEQDLVNCWSLLDPGSQGADGWHMSIHCSQLRGVLHEAENPSVELLASDWSVWLRWFLKLVLLSAISHSCCVVRRPSAQWQQIRWHQVVFKDRFFEDRWVHSFAVLNDGWWCLVWSVGGWVARNTQKG